MEFEVSTGAHLKEVRLRLGWCAAELARHLSISVDEVMLIEQSKKTLSVELSVKLKATFADLIRFADDYSARLKQDPVAEKIMLTKRLSQITGSSLFHLNEKDFVE